MTERIRIMRDGHDDKRPPLPGIFSAAERNDVTALRTATKRVSVNVIDEDGMTPLHYAAASLAFEAVAYLLSVEGIDPTITDRYGRTAATVAHESWGEYGDQMVEELISSCYPMLANPPV